jgi:CheY-like chemotaxis protein
VADVLELMSPIALARSVTVVGDGDGVGHVRADRQRLKQVLVNLVANAVKYNREGGIVQVRFAPRGTGAVRVSVTDSGPGLSAEEQQRLFTPFERLGADGTDIEGTGLGLALSQQLVEAMGGTLQVDWTPGRGATFWFELEPCAAPASAAEFAAETAAASASRMRRVLYIEDNMANVQLVERLLEHRPNVELVVAMHGGLGLELAAEHPADLVLVDINLPDLSGHTILRRLRSDMRTSGVPIVVVSADATPTQKAACKAAGADGYLTKPFDIPAFFAVIDEHLGEGDSPSIRWMMELDGFEPSIVDLLARIHEREGAGDLIEAYERETRDQMGRLIDAYAQCDAASAQALAHSMKGATGTIGAVRLTGLLAELERAIADGREDVAAIVVRVSDELDRAVSLLRNVFAAA